jgi:hypothetical protein
MVGEKVESKWAMGKEQKVDVNGWLRLVSHSERPRGRRIREPQHVQHLVFDEKPKTGILSPMICSI